jgi:Beta-L-arabinofuranosidase, GH127
MAYWQATRDAAVLAAARRLAAFLLAVREATKAPAVMARVEGQGAFGFICFTQLAEGLAMLTLATGDGRYAAAAREIVPLLQPRGVQHSHGYFSTLRGAVLLHEADGDPAMLAFAERFYGELVRSSDYTVDGGVMEYFGWGDPTSAASLAAAKAASGVFPRNEGCGLADFVRLSLQLHHATGQAEYLERPERCPVNGFAHNQYANGDFARGPSSTRASSRRPA